MNRLKNRMFGTLVLTAMLVFAVGTAYSQTDSTKEHKMYETQNSMTQNSKYGQDVSMAASMLRMKLDLTMEQTKRVEGILQNYKDHGTNTAAATSTDNTIDKVENVLTADQKTKFDNVKTQWWSETQKKLSKSSNLNDTHTGTDNTWKK